MKILQCILIFTIRTYQRTLSPDHGVASMLTPVRACRFEPTCSEYVIDALREYGVSHGVWNGMRRIGRCHPWSSGGYDPIKKKSHA